MKSATGFQPGNKLLEYDILNHIKNFVPYFQPIIDVTSGLVAGYESLARQLDHVGTAQPAGHIFSDRTISDKAKLTIDRHVRSLAIDHFSRRLSSGFLSINISPDWVSLLENDRDIPTIKMIENSGIDPSKLIIEFTEHSGELEKLKRLTEIYQRAGIRVAIDDFGVGGSQVDRIIALQPDMIKLDMTLFKLASLGGPEADVILSIASIAQRAGCEIVCEGVETEQEFHFALECGADYIQGWLYQQAIETTVPATQFSLETATYKRNYLERKSDLQMQVAKHNREVTGQVQMLCEYFRKHFPNTNYSLEGIDSNRLARLGVLRIFICDSSGEQISPNYEISDLGVGVNADTIGYNWSHRPYFPLLHAMHAIQLDHVLVSKPYKDIVCGSMCKTLGVFISDRNVLLVDVVSKDNVLFQSGVTS